MKKAIPPTHSDNKIQHMLFLQEIILPPQRLSILKLNRHQHPTNR